MSLRVCRPACRSVSPSVSASCLRLVCVVFASLGVRFHVVRVVSLSVGLAVGRPRWVLSVSSEMPTQALAPSVEAGVCVCAHAGGARKCHGWLEVTHRVSQSRPCFRLSSASVLPWSRPCATSAMLASPCTHTCPKGTRLLFCFVCTPLRGVACVSPKIDFGLIPRVARLWQFSLRLIMLLVGIKAVRGQ